ncbi:peptidase M50B-like-domain-containing protein [Phellopilus nigrolimitatus]|nr:peptidase M50B-like-domain-containing protein [Phellopilus nigrolimitatus]
MPALNEHDAHDFLQIFPRDVRSQLTPSATQRTTLIVAGCYVIAIAILWHVPVLNWIIYPFKCVLTVGFHEMSHAIAGLLTCAHIESIELDPDEGGATRMSGGVPIITLPAGYLGSSFIGACLIACGFDIDASKVACIVLAAFFLFTLWWARRNWLTWALILGMSAIIILFWFVKGGVALRYFVLFIGVMSCMYVLWDVIDDTIARKVNSSDASAFAHICGCCPSQVWGVIWLIIAFCFFAAGIVVGLAAFKQSESQQEQDSLHFIPIPGASAGFPSASLSTSAVYLVSLASTAFLVVLGL